MLAEKIYKIQKELEEKRRTRRQQLQQQGQMTLQGGAQGNAGGPHQPGQPLRDGNSMIPSVPSSNPLSNMNGKCAI